MKTTLQTKHTSYNTFSQSWLGLSCAEFSVRNTPAMNEYKDIKGALYS